MGDSLVCFEVKNNKPQWCVGDEVEFLVWFENRFFSSGREVVLTSKLFRGGVSPRLILTDEGREKGGVIKAEIAAYAPEDSGQVKPRVLRLDGSGTESSISPGNELSLNVKKLPLLSALTLKQTSPPQVVIPGATIRIVVTLDSPAQKDAEAEITGGERSVVAKFAKGQSDATVPVVLPAAVSPTTLTVKAPKDDAFWTGGCRHSLLLDPPKLIVLIDKPRVFFCPLDMNQGLAQGQRAEVEVTSEPKVATPTVVRVSGTGCKVDASVELTPGSPTRKLGVGLVDAQPKVQLAMPGTQDLWALGTDSDKEPREITLTPSPLVEFEAVEPGLSLLPGQAYSLKVTTSRAPTRADPAIVRILAERCAVSEETLTIKDAGPTEVTLTAPAGDSVALARVRLEPKKGCSLGARGLLEIPINLPKLSVSESPREAVTPGAEVEITLELDPAPWVQTRVELATEDLTLVKVTGAATLVEGSALVFKPVQDAGAKASATVWVRVADPPTQQQAVLTLTSPRACSLVEPTEAVLQLPGQAEVSLDVADGPYRPGAKTELTFSLKHAAAGEVRVNLTLTNCRGEAVVTFPAGAKTQTLPLELEDAGVAIVEWSSKETPQQRALIVRSASNPKGTSDECVVANRDVLGRVRKSVEGWQSVFRDDFRQPHDVFTRRTAQQTKLLNDLKRGSYEATLNSDHKALYANYNVGAVGGPLLEALGKGDTGFALLDQAVSRGQDLVKAQATESADLHQKGEQLPALGEGWISRDFVLHHLQRRVQADASHASCPLCGRSDAHGEDAGDPVARLCKVPADEALSAVVEALTVADGVYMDLLQRAATASGAAGGLVGASQRPTDKQYGDLVRLADGAKTCREISGIMLRLAELERQVCLIEANVTPILVITEVLGTRLRKWRRALDDALVERASDRGFVGFKFLMDDALKWITEHEEAMHIEPPPWEAHRGKTCQRGKVVDDADADADEMAFDGLKWVSLPARSFPGSKASALADSAGHCYGTKTGGSECVAPFPVDGLRGFFGLGFARMSKLNDGKIREVFDAQAGSSMKPPRSSAELGELTSVLRGLLAETEREAKEALARERSPEVADGGRPRWEALLEDVRWTVRHQEFASMKSAAETFFDPRLREAATEALRTTYELGNTVFDGLDKAGVAVLPAVKLAAMLTPHGAVVLGAVSVGGKLLAQYKDQMVKLYEVAKWAHKRGTAATNAQRTRDRQALSDTPEDFAKMLKLDQGVATYWLKNISFHLDDASKNYQRMAYYALRAREDVLVAKEERWRPDCDEVLGFMWAYYKLLKHTELLAKFAWPLADILQNLLKKLEEYDEFWRKGVEPLLQELEKKVQEHKDMCAGVAPVSVPRGGADNGAVTRVVVPSPGDRVCYGPLDPSKSDDPTPAASLRTATALDRINRFNESAEGANQGAKSLLELQSRAGDLRRQVQRLLGQSGS